MVDWVRQRVKELLDQGLSVDMVIVNRYTLSEPPPPQGIKVKVDVMDLDPIDEDENE